MRKVFPQCQIFHPGKKLAAVQQIFVPLDMMKFKNILFFLMAYLTTANAVIVMCGKNRWLVMFSIQR